MNSTGIDYPEIIKKHLKTQENIEYDKKTFNEINIKELEEMYYFSEYYKILINEKINTPLSRITTLNRLYKKPKKINKIINTQFNGKVFARLDRCSSKPESFFKNSGEIKKSLKMSNRTNQFLNDKEHKLILREYINDINDYHELRCIVHDNKLRGVSGPQNNRYMIKDNDIKKIKQNLCQYIDNICYITDYNCATIDILIKKDNIYNIEEYIVLEINPPVWLTATSGLFDLSSPEDTNILFEKYCKYIDYPIIKYTVLNDDIRSDIIITI